MKRVAPRSRVKRVAPFGAPSHYTLASGELVAAVSGLGLLVVSFLPWYSAGGQDATAWQAFSVVDLFIAAGVPANKIVLGAPFYGKAWGEVPPADNGLHQPGKRVTVRLRSNFRDIKADLEGKDAFVRYWVFFSKAPHL